MVHISYFVYQKQCFTLLYSSVKQTYFRSKHITYTLPFFWFPINKTIRSSKGFLVQEYISGQFELRLRVFQRGAKQITPDTLGIWPDTKPMRHSYSFWFASQSSLAVRFLRYESNWDWGQSNKRKKRDSIAFSLFVDILVELDKSEANPNNNLMIFIRALSSMSSWYIPSQQYCFSFTM